MEYQVHSITTAHRTADDDGLGLAPVDLLDEPTADDLELDEDFDAPPLPQVTEEPGMIGSSHVSYGLADILFPVTPPKPKGARLIRGPLRFN